MFVFSFYVIHRLKWVPFNPFQKITYIFGNEQINLFQKKKCMFFPFLGEGRGERKDNFIEKLLKTITLWVQYILEHK